MNPELVFVGTGEALDPELPNTSLLVHTGATTLLLDCGYSVPQALWSITRDADLLDAVWISHGHADHCFGLPALLLWMRLAGRKRSLTVLGGPGSQARLERVLELGYPNSFAPHKCYPLEFVELEVGPEHRFAELGLRIAPTIHSLANWALRLDIPRAGMPARSLVYSGDGAPTEASRTLCEGASLLVHECFTPEPLAGERKHGDLLGVLELARAAKVERLAILHFARDARVAILAAAAANPAIIVAKPGDRLDL